MKKVLSVIAVVAFAGASFGGDFSKMVDLKQPIIEQEICFDKGELQFDVFGAYAVSTQHNNTLENNGWGGGIGLNYFFTKYLGAGVEGYWLAVDQTLHGVSGSVIARLPFEGSFCWAPYLFVGGGGLFDSSNTGNGHAGGGFDFRFSKSIGLILDSRYVYGGNAEDFVLNRAGLRFVF